MKARLIDWALAIFIFAGFIALVLHFAPRARGDDANDAARAALALASASASGCPCGVCDCTPAKNCGCLQPKPAGIEVPAVKKLSLDAESLAAGWVAADGEWCYHAATGTWCNLATRTMYPPAAVQGYAYGGAYSGGGCANGSCGAGFAPVMGGARGGKCGLGGCR